MSTQEVWSTRKQFTESGARKESGACNFAMDAPEILWSLCKLSGAFPEDGNSLCNFSKSSQKVWSSLCKFAMTTPKCYLSYQRKFLRELISSE